MGLLHFLLSPRGRSPRLHWWIGGFVPAILLSGIGFLAEPMLDTDPVNALLWIVAAILLGAWSGFCIQVRRLHDLDKSAWWMLLFLIPVIGPLWIGFESGFLRGVPGTNRFGSSHATRASLEDDAESQDLKKGPSDEWLAAKARELARARLAAAPVKASASATPVFGKRA